MNVDDIKLRYVPRETKIAARDNSYLRDEIESKTQIFLQNKGKIQQLESCTSSPAVDFKTHLSQQAKMGLLK